MDVGAAQFQAPANNIPGAMIDVDTQDGGGGSDWELGSGVDSEEGGWGGLSQRCLHRVL